MGTRGTSRTLVMLLATIKVRRRRQEPGSGPGPSAGCRSAGVLIHIPGLVLRPP